VFTHGVEIGIARNESHDLQTATDELLASLAQGNPNLSRPSGYSRGRVAGQNGLRAELQNVSEATGQREAIEVYTTQMRDGNLFYAVAVAPQNAYSSYRGIFDRIVSSIQLAQ
jgi:hypothetical protein